MQVKRIVPKYVLPIALAAMTFAKVAAAKPNQLQDRFEKREPKTEVVNNPDKKDSKPSWKIHLISGGAILLLLGIIKLGDIIDKKESEREDAKPESDEIKE